MFHCSISRAKESAWEYLFYFPVTWTIFKPCKSTSPLYLYFLPLWALTHVIVKLAAAYSLSVGFSSVETVPALSQKMSNFSNEAEIIGWITQFSILLHYQYQTWNMTRLCSLKMVSVPAYGSWFWFKVCEGFYSWTKYHIETFLTDIKRHWQKHEWPRFFL